MSMILQAQKMFEEKISRHKAYRDQLARENAPRSQIEFVEHCIADLEKMIAGPCKVEPFSPGQDDVEPSFEDD